jgi:hypothetical protein
MKPSTLISINDFETEYKFYAISPFKAE